MLLGSLILGDRADFMVLGDVILSEQGGELKELHNIAGKGACFV